MTLAQSDKRSKSGTSSIYATTSTPSTTLPLSFSTTFFFNLLNPLSMLEYFHMEMWFIFAVLSALSAGLYSFSLKASAHYKHHASQVTMYAMLSASVLSGVYAILQDHRPTIIILIILLAFINVSAYSAYSISRIEGLKNIDSTILFPIIKISSSILIIPISFGLFGDYFTFTQFIGICIGLTTPILLITKKEQLLQKNLKKGLILVAIAVASAIVVTVATKTINFWELDFSLYMFFVFSFGVLMNAVSFKKTKHKEHSKLHVEWVGLLGGVFMFLNLFFYLQALSGSLTVVFVINSFSTVFAVILAVLMFKERFDIKKGLALIVTVISLVLLK